MNRATGENRARATLPYAFRLHQRHDFLRFFDGSSVARLRHSIVFRVPNSHGHFRLGVTFKIKCSSVERNALRRQIRETFRRLGPQLGSFDYNLVVRSYQKPMARFARALAMELQTSLQAERFQEAKPRAS